MILHIQKPIQFSSPNEVLFDREDLKKAIIWYSKPKPVARLKHVYLHGRYYAISIYDQKIHIHRLLMMYWKKRDLQTNEHVHHINGNKFNNLKENLQLMLGSAHISLTHKGKPKSVEHRRKMSLANTRRKGMITTKTAHITSQGIQWLRNEGWSISKIARYYKVDWETIKKRSIYENPELLEDLK